MVIACRSGPEPFHIPGHPNNKQHRYQDQDNEKNDDIDVDAVNNDDGVSAAAQQQQQQQQGNKQQQEEGELRPEQMVPLVWRNLTDDRSKQTPFWATGDDVKNKKIKKMGAVRWKGHRGGFNLRLHKRLKSQGHGDRVEWATVDAMNQTAVEHLVCDEHADATAVISAIGLLNPLAPSACRRVNGVANVNIAAAVCKAIQRNPTQQQQQRRDGGGGDSELHGSARTTADHSNHNQQHQQESLLPTDVFKQKYGLVDDDEHATTTSTTTNMEKFVYISAARFGVPFLEGFTLKGYYDGKRVTEAACADMLAGHSAVIRPAFVTGWRETTKGWWVLVPSPNKLLLNPLYHMSNKQYKLFTPASNVDDVAKAALQCALNQPPSAVAKAAAVSSSSSRKPRGSKNRRRSGATGKNNNDNEEEQSSNIFARMYNSVVSLGSDVLRMSKTTNEAEESSGAPATDATRTRHRSSSQGEEEENDKAEQQQEEPESLDVSMKKTDEWKLADASALAYGGGEEEVSPRRPLGHDAILAMADRWDRHHMEVASDSVRDYARRHHRHNSHDDDEDDAEDKDVGNSVVVDDAADAHGENNQKNKNEIGGGGGGSATAAVEKKSAGTETETEKNPSTDTRAFSAISTPSHEKKQQQQLKPEAPLLLLKRTTEQNNYFSAPTTKKATSSALATSAAATRPAVISPTGDVGAVATIAALPVFMLFLAAIPFSAFVASGFFSRKRSPRRKSLKKGTSKSKKDVVMSF